MVKTKGMMTVEQMETEKHIVFETTAGTFEAELYPKDAPITCENFIRLVRKGFYNGLKFHRIAKGFVVQGGDPKGDGTGGASVYDQAFEDELYPNTPSYQAGYKKGVMAMANSGPNTNGCQFFMMLVDAQLPHLYTIFGKVVKGQEVVDAIGKVETSPPDDGFPLRDIIMKKVYIKQTPQKGGTKKTK
jgi:cyclophilin family peptidyl-prolyl cis-trans isomerase